MTKDEHQAKHSEQYSNLEALFTDFVYHTTKSRALCFERMVSEFMNWSYQQTINPTEIREEVSDG